MAVSCVWLGVIILYCIDSSFGNLKGDNDVPSDVCVIILNQRHEHKHAMGLSDSLRNTHTDMNVLVSSLHFSDLETHAIVPIFPRLRDLYGSQCTWFMLVTPQTRLRPSTDDHLSTILLQYPNPMTTAYFLGLALNDQQLSITHHFLPRNFIQYPLLCAGVLLSNMAINRIADNYDEHYKTVFVIDPVFELALFLKYLRIPSPMELHNNSFAQPEHGVILTHVNALCSNPSIDCVTHCVREHHCIKQYPLTPGDVIFAVKTYRMNHKTRLPVMWNTWTGNPSHLNIKYFSDIVDDEYGTIHSGVDNTATGHCSKLLSILRLMMKLYSNFHWLVVCDDDTLLSVPRLSNLLSCFDHTKPMIIGEMYGYRAHYNGSGYLYPTGGSGIVFSRPAVESIIQSGTTCPTDNYPDDMFIGLTASLQLDIPLIHSPTFHQDQPNSYHPMLLEITSSHISFHRHRPDDPIEIYHTYLEEGESQETPPSTSASQSISVKSEL